MKEVTLTPDLTGRIRRIYEAMEREYDQVAKALAFSCDGCPDNCCDSWFQHHTFVEWAYLWLGFSELPPERRTEILERSQAHVTACAQALAKGERPQVMCPLNQGGRCTLYAHRLMVCRTHGVPAAMRRPDGQRLEFPGCFRCQDLVGRAFPEHERDGAIPRVERTPLLRELALLENELMDGKRHLYPRLKLTIAQMLVQGPPQIATPHCER